MADAVPVSRRTGTGFVVNKQEIEGKKKKERDIEKKKKHKNER